MKNATVGQLMIDQVLPEDMRGQNRVLNKQGLRDLMRELAVKHPEQYREVSHDLARIGMQVAYTTGGNSFGLQHLLPAASAVAARKKLRQQINALLDNDDLTDAQRDELILKYTGRLGDQQSKAIYEESLAEDNPLAYQVLSGSRGNPMNLASLRGSDLLYTDHRNRALPVPIMHSYSQGLSPLEYWAGAYGARKGTMDTKFATQDAGFLSKQLNQIVHRALITALDDEEESATVRGLPVDVNDDESEGALLAAPVAGYKRNTVITPKILQSLRARKIKRILVRSPAVGGPGDGGIFARDAGIREYGHLPSLGENVGMTAAQAMSEPLSQAQLSSKHTGGVAGASAAQAVSGFDWINQLVQTPKQFKGGAAHAEVDGLVQRIEDAPAGGKYVWIENQRHYIGAGFEPKVQRGDHVEAGDVISDGAPNPAIVVMYKGIGEGRRYFINAFRQAFRDAGIKGHRRNIELLAKGLINHVRLTEEIGDYVPDDVVTYQQLERSWKPRPGAELVAPNNAVGRYLERPYLHYSIGTKVRPSMLKDFQDFGIAEIETHEDQPPFQPEMVRGMANLQHDPDWITRMFGSGLKKGLERGVHRGATSDPTGTSFVPGLARGTDFGHIGKVRTPTPWPKNAMACAAEHLRMKMAADDMVWGVCPGCGREHWLPNTAEVAQARAQRSREDPAWEDKAKRQGGVTPDTAKTPEEQRADQEQLRQQIIESQNVAAGDKPMSPQAARYLLQNQYQANRYADSLARQMEQQRLFGGRGAEGVQNTLALYNLPGYFTPGYGQIVGGADFLQWGSDMGHAWDNPVAEGEIAPITSDTPGGSWISPQRWLSEMQDPLFEEMVQGGTYHHSDWPYPEETYQGDQYAIPGKGKWIDQYNQAIAAGTKPDYHVTLNAIRELEALPAETYDDYWAANAISQDPAIAKMMYDNEVLDFGVRSRERVADDVFGNYRALLSKKHPGWDEGLDETHPRNLFATFEMLGGARKNLMQMDQLRQKYILGQIDGKQYQAEMDKIVGNQPGSGAERWWDISEIEKPYNAEFEKFKRSRHELYQLHTAQPEEREALLQQQQARLAEQDQAASMERRKRLAQQNPGSDPEMDKQLMWEQARSATRDWVDKNIPAAAEGAPADPAKDRYVWDRFLQLLNQKGAKAFDFSDQYFIGRLQQAYETGAIDEAGVERMFQQYDPILESHLAAHNPGYRQPQTTKPQLGMSPQQPGQQPVQTTQQRQPAQQQPAQQPPAQQQQPRYTQSPTVPTTPGTPQYDQAVAAQGTSQPTQRQSFQRRSVPWGMQLARMAPKPTSSMISGLGPAGIGAYGLLFNPSAVMTLAAGPSMPKLPNPMKPPQSAGALKPQKPVKLPQTPKKPPSSKDFTWRSGLSRRPVTRLASTPKMFGE